MTTATRETPNPNLPGPCPGAERMVWPVQTHRAQSTGPESKKNSGDGENFFLDFSFYRTGLIHRPSSNGSSRAFGAGRISARTDSRRPALDLRTVPVEGQGRPRSN